MTTTALVRGARIAQAFLGAKIHDPKDPGADLGPMFTQVVGTLLALAKKNADAWLGIRSSRAIPVLPEDSAVLGEPEPVKASVPILVEKFRQGQAEQKRIWNEVFTAPTRGYIAAKTQAEGPEKAVDGRVWAKAVYELLAAARYREDTEALARALLPLYYGRVAVLIDEVAQLDQAGAERVFEQQALVFEERKPYLLERWAAAEPSRA
jgi:hypothetical protein